MKASHLLKTFLVLFCISFTLVSYGQRNPVTWQGQATKLASGKYKIELSAEIQPGWYVYSQKLESDMGPVPTSFEFSAGGELLLDGEATEAGNRQEGMDKAFGMNVVKYLDNVTFTQKLDVPEGTKQLECIVTFMTCNGDLCLPPKDVPIQIKL